jgi:hypothetical protein
MDLLLAAAVGLLDGALHRGGDLVGIEDHLAVVPTASATQSRARTVSPGFQYGPRGSHFRVNFQV